MHIGLSAEPNPLFHQINQSVSQSVVSFIQYITSPPSVQAIDPPIQGYRTRIQIIVPVAWKISLFL